MPFLAFLTPVWAWALPIAGPLLVVASKWVAGARSRIPVGSGSAIFGAAVALILGLMLWHKVDAWWNPPPVTFTAAEIEASRLKAEKAALEQVIESRRIDVAKRDTSIEHLAEINEQITSELEQERAKAVDPDGVVLPADDPWLRAWHRRGW